VDTSERKDPQNFSYKDGRSFALSGGVTSSLTLGGAGSGGGVLEILGEERSGVRRGDALWVGLGSWLTRLVRRNRVSGGVEGLEGFRPGEGGAESRNGLLDGEKNGKDVLGKGPADGRASSEEWSWGTWLRSWSDLPVRRIDVARLVRNGGQIKTSSGG
jgi:hypothetical protein